MGPPSVPGQTARGLTNAAIQDPEIDPHGFEVDHFVDLCSQPMHGDQVGCASMEALFVIFYAGTFVVVIII